MPHALALTEIDSVGLLDCEIRNRRRLQADSTFLLAYSDIEIDLLPDYMRSGKPGFERIRTGLRKLGEKDFIASYTDATGKQASDV